jgi:hypothetical protein
MKPKTYCKTVRFTQQMMDDWEYLKSVNVRPADILREATESALLSKATEMKYELSHEILPF